MKCERCTNQASHRVSFLGLFIEYLCAFHYEWHITHRSWDTVSECNSLWNPSKVVA